MAPRWRPMKGVPMTGVTRESAEEHGGAADVAHGGGAVGLARLGHEGVGRSAAPRPARRTRARRRARLGAGDPDDGRPGDCALGHRRRRPGQGVRGGDQQRLRALTGDAGSAIVDFALVGGLVTVLFVAVLQLTIVLHVRNTLVDSAGEGARYGALAGHEPADGAQRARDLIAQSLSSAYAQGVTAGRTTLDGLDVVEVEVRGAAAAGRVWSVRRAPSPSAGTRWSRSREQVVGRTPRTADRRRGQLGHRVPGARGRAADPAGVPGPDARAARGGDVRHGRGGAGGRTDVRRGRRGRRGRRAGGRRRRGSRCGTRASTTTPPPR